MFFFFFFIDAAPPAIYTLSLHDALPICELLLDLGDVAMAAQPVRLHALVDFAEHQVGLGLAAGSRDATLGDRKSTRLNSSHITISYAVFCLKKKKKQKKDDLIAQLLLLK